LTFASGMCGFSASERQIAPPVHASLIGRE
jgi:hypothetical protein